MPRTALPSILAALIYLVCVNPASYAQIWLVNYSTSAGSNKVNLQSVGVIRGGPSFTYQFNQMTLGTVTAVNIPGEFRSVILAPDGYPGTGAPNAFLNDQVLNSGMVTPGLGNGTFLAGDEFTEYTFTKPVVNGPGGDLVLGFITFDFGDFQSDPGPYWLMPGGGSPTLIDRAADQDLSAVAIIPYFEYLNGGPTAPSDFLATNVQQTGGLGNANAIPRPSLQTVDLSELGIPLGGSISSLRIWDDNLSNGNTIYPTLIAGLPNVPEPSTGVLAVMGAIVCLGLSRARRKRRA